MSDLTDTIAAAAPALLQCRGIGKRFAGVAALEGVDFSLNAGEIHGVVGSNGAGKSTLMKILAGALPDHDGTVLFEGRPLKLANPQQALQHGIAMVYQELSGIGQLSVAENLFLGRQPTGRFGRIDWKMMRRKAQEYLAELEIDVCVERRLDRYPLVIRQMVEIARGIHSGATVLILDEPTSALSPPETRRLFELVERLRDRGMAIVLISHFIEDVLAVSDRITILRNGRRLETTARSKLDKHYVIRTMLGHSLQEQEVGYESGRTLPPRRAGEAVLAARRLTVTGAFEGVDLEVSAGECLGVYGFVGSGHQDLVHALGGLRRPSSGDVLIDGRPLKAGGTYHAVRQGVVLVLADRAKSLFHRGENFKNATLAHLREAIGNWLTRGKESAVTCRALERVGCRPADPHMLTGKLSGGNQQKVVLAKWLLSSVRVLLLEEPTRGMDVAAKEEIMRLIRQLKQQGTAVVLASAEPEMVLAHADRILVLSRGRVVKQFVDTSVDKPMLMRYA